MPRQYRHKLKAQHISLDLFGSALLVPSSFCTRAHLGEPETIPASISLYSFLVWMDTGGGGGCRTHNHPWVLSRICYHHGSDCPLAWCTRSVGSRLYVSNAEVEIICQEIWKVPAEVAGIEFREGNAASSSRPSTLHIHKDKQDDSIALVDGWANTRTIDTMIEVVQ